MANLPPAIRAAGSVAGTRLVLSPDGHSRGQATRSTKRQYIFFNLSDMCAYL
jgi:hypothetical protein